LTASDTNKENGVQILVTDVNGVAIQDALVIFYSSQIAAIDDSLFTSIGSDAKLITNSQRSGLVSKLPQGYIYKCTTPV
jgi:hypothetical protein